MLNRNDLRALRAHEGYPCLSVLLPTHRTHPENRQDPTRLKNLLTQGRERLLAEFPARQVQPLLDRAEALAAEVDHERNLDGLALFASNEFGLRCDLPFPVEERAEVGPVFAIRDLVQALNRSPRYRVLVLSEQPTRLYEGVREMLHEVRAGGFPLTHEGPGGATNLPGGWGQRRSAHRDERHRQFFRTVDEAYGAVAAGDPLPLVLTGVEKFVAAFREVSEHGDDIVSVLPGSYDATPPHELAALVLPLIDAALHARRGEALARLEAAVGAGRFAAGLQEVWGMSRDGRVDLLLVEEEYRAPARIAPGGVGLLPPDAEVGPDALDDAVDDIVEAVLAHGGQVVFTDPGSLAAQQQIAAVLRY